MVILAGPVARVRPLGAARRRAGLVALALTCGLSAGLSVPEAYAGRVAPLSPVIVSPGAAPATPAAPPAPASAPAPAAAPTTTAPPAPDAGLQTLPRVAGSGASTPAGHRRGGPPVIAVQKPQAVSGHKLGSGSTGGLPFGSPSASPPAGGNRVAAGGDGVPGGDGGAVAG